MARKSAFFEVSKVFFDREAVVKRVDRATARMLIQHGQDTKHTAKRSLKTGRSKAEKKKPSPPGTPPRSRKPHKLKKGIVYWYDWRRQNVVTGPVLFPRVKRRDNLVMLEYGGARTMQVPFRGRVLAKYPPRPFMRPAQTKVIPKTLRKLKDSI